MNVNRVELPKVLDRQLRTLTGVKYSPRSLPRDVYVSDEILALERQTLFSDNWIGVGRIDRWKNNGDYAALTVGDTALLIVRNRDGKLQALSNVCTHRGTRLIDPGSGQTGAIVCPFHQWTFDLDGTLKGAPGMHETAGFDRANHCLKRYRIAEHAGFVFVCLSDNSDSLQNWLKDFDQVHAPWPLSDLLTTRRRSFDVACNWKLFLDVFNEYYHLPSVHPASINKAYATPDAPEEVQGQFTTQFGLTKATASLLHSDQQQQRLPDMPALSGRASLGTRYTWLFPNMTFAASSDCLWMYDVLPITAELTHVSMTICVPRENISDGPDFESILERYYRRFDLAIEEDIAVLERQQAGMRSSSARQGPFSSTEPGVARFAAWYAERLTAQQYQT